MLGLLVQLVHQVVMVLKAYEVQMAQRYINFYTTASPMYMCIGTPRCNGASWPDGRKRRCRS